MAAINPYLNFTNQCEEAFNFYKSVFGGEFLAIMRFGEYANECHTGEGESQKIMHVALPIGKHNILMGSDIPDAMGELHKGNQVNISIQAESEEEADRLFNGLSAGGTVTMPMEKSFWNAYFGMFTDKFGINWLINYDYNQQK